MTQTKIVSYLDCPFHGTIRQDRFEPVDTRGNPSKWTYRCPAAGPLEMPYEHTSIRYGTETLMLPIWKCPVATKVREVKVPVKGYGAILHECDGRCLSGKHFCQCKCGGRCHGAGSCSCPGVRSDG